MSLIAEIRLKKQEKQKNLTNRPLPEHFMEQATIIALFS